MGTAKLASHSNGSHQSSCCSVAYYAGHSYTSAGIVCETYPQVDLPCEDLPARPPAEGV